MAQNSKEPSKNGTHKSNNVLQTSENKLQQPWPQKPTETPETNLPMPHHILILWPSQ